MRPWSAITGRSAARRKGAHCRKSHLRWQLRCCLGAILGTMVAGFGAQARLRFTPSPALLAALGDAALAGSGSPKSSAGLVGHRGRDLSMDQIRFRTRALMWGGAGAVALYGATTWWRAGVSGRFRASNEGWFAQSTYAGGADKLGHLYSAYLGTRLLTLGYQWAGNDRQHSGNLAAATTLGTLMAVELMDGFSKQYRFSLQDALMNTAGVGFGVLMERYPALDKLIAFRLRYWPSQGATFDPVDNYSGQTYLFVLKAAGIPALQHTVVLRYLELAVGYGSRGYESRNPADHSRHVYVGLSLNLSQILNDTVFRGERHGDGAQRTTDTFLKYVQVPGTSLLSDHQLTK